MKKIIYLAFAFAIATTAITGCGKVYDEIDGVKSDLVNFQNGPFKTVQEQVEGLQAQVANLETAKTAIEADIAKLRTDGETNASKIAALEASVKTINDAIKVIKDDIAEKADQSYVDQQIQTINSNLAAVEATAKAAQTTADQGVAAADAAQKAADKAQTDATKALEEIEALKGVVEAMYTNAQIDAMFEDLEGKVNDKEKDLKKYVDDVKAEIYIKIDEAIKLLNKQYELNTGEIEKNKQAIEDNKIAIEKNKQAIEDLNKNLIEQLNTLKKALLEYVEDLAARITSVSVIPTLTPEIEKVVLGDQELDHFTTSVVVSPASAAKTIAEQFKEGGKNVKILLQQGLTKAVDPVYPTVDKITSVTAGDNGVLTIKAEFNKYDILGTEDIQTYYAVQVSQKDGIESTVNTVTSEFVRAHESVTDLWNEIQIVWYDCKTAEKTTDLDMVMETEENIPYIDFAIPFERKPYDYKIPVIVYKEKDYDAYEFEKETGMPTNFTFTHMFGNKSDDQPVNLDGFFTFDHNSFKLKGIMDRDSVTLRKALYNSTDNKFGVKFVAYDYKLNNKAVEGMKLTRTYSSIYWERDVFDVKTHINVEWNYKSKINSEGKFIGELFNYVVNTGIQEGLEENWKQGSMKLYEPGTIDHSNVELIYDSEKGASTIKITKAELGEAGDVLTFRAGFDEKWANRYTVRYTVDYANLPKIATDVIDVAGKDITVPVNDANANKAVENITLNCIKAGGGFGMYTKGLQGLDATLEYVATALIEATSYKFQNIKINNVAMSESATVEANEVKKIDGILKFKSGVFEVGKTYKIEADIIGFGTSKYHVTFNVTGGEAVK